MRKPSILFIVIGLAAIGYGGFTWSQGRPLLNALIPIVGGLILIGTELAKKRRRP